MVFEKIPHGVAKESTIRKRPCKRPGVGLLVKYLFALPHIFFGFFIISRSRYALEELLSEQPWIYYYDEWFTVSTRSDFISIFTTSLFPIPADLSARFSTIIFPPYCPCEFSQFVGSTVMYSRREESQTLLTD